MMHRESPMRIVTRRIVIGVLATMPAGSARAATAAPPTGAYAVNTFEFVPSEPPQDVGEAVPNVWIDTNMKLSGLSGGTLTSSLPCAVRIDYTDNSLAFRSVVFTSVRVTYDDGAADPAARAVRLPLRIAAREYETVNSVAGGRIVKSKAWVVSGAIPDVVTRAVPFRLRIEGHFAKSGGEKVPFSIDRHFDIEEENAVRSAEEVLQDK